MPKFGRAAKLEVLNPTRRVVVEASGRAGLRVDFEVMRSLKPEANTGIVTVFNLAARTRDAISDVVRRKLALTEAEREALRAAGASGAPIEQVYDNMGIAYVRLLVGYASRPDFPPVLGGLLEGDSQTIRHQRDGQDWVTQIEVGDAETALREAFLAKSYGKGTRVVDVIVDLVKTLGASVTPQQRGLLTSKLGGAGNTVLPKGWSASGSAFAYLQEFLRLLEIEWSIQDGAFLVLDNEPGAALSVLPDPPLQVSQAAGMVGTPRPLESGGYEVAVLCDPEAKPGRACHVVSEEVRGAFRIEQVRHSGSTRGGPWVSLMELQNLEALP